MLPHTAAQQTINLLLFAFNEKVSLVYRVSGNQCQYMHLQVQTCQYRCFSLEIESSHFVLDFEAPMTLHTALSVALSLLLA